MLELNVLTGNYISPPPPPPYESTRWGKYYDLVIVILPLPLCPQTLHQTHDKSLLEYFHMLRIDLYRREDRWEERSAQSDI